MRHFRDKKRWAIAKEMSKLFKAGFVKEVIHTKWVANPVLVPKKNTNVRCMCVDYMGLNKACPKDRFPLPRIEQVIDSMAGSELLCFLDAYSGYHQIYQNLVTGTYKARNKVMAAYKDEVDEMAKSFIGYAIKYV
jgi:hypothetical protein